MGTIKKIGTEQDARAESRKKIAIVMHSVLNLKFFWVPILNALSEVYDVVLYIGNDKPKVLADIELTCRVEVVPIQRKISPYNDVRALFSLYRCLRRDKPDLLQTVTPKAGLIGMLAGYFAGVSLRVHTFQGQVWATAEGGRRALLRHFDKVIAMLSTSVLADSGSQLQFLRDNNVLRQCQGQVLGSGSIAGVDLTRFSSNRPENSVLMNGLGIRRSDFVFLYLGRLTREKGLLVLADAFALAKSRISSEIKLLVVGPDEDDMADQLQRKLGQAVLIHPYTDCPEDYLSLASVVVLPSFREGFGSVLIEAAAMGIPTIASRIYGIDCAVQDGESGLLVESGNHVELADAMCRLYKDARLYEEMSRYGKEMAKKDFEQGRVIRNLISYYQQELERLSNTN